MSNSFYNHYRHRQHDRSDGSSQTDGKPTTTSAASSREPALFPSKPHSIPHFSHGKNMPEKLRFSVKSFMNMAKRANKKIGFVVDLTNTDRYYKKTEWADDGVQYLKLNCPGHDVNEREDLVEGFIKSVREFVEDSENVFEYYVDIQWNDNITKSLFMQRHKEGSRKTMMKTRGTRKWGI